MSSCIISSTVGALCAAIAICVPASMAFAQTTDAASPKSYTCEHNKNEPAKRICTNRSAQIYLLENFDVEIGKNLDLAGVTCNWEATIAPKGKAGTDVLSSGIVCENDDPKNKLIVGWSSNEKILQLMKHLGDYQLLLQGKHSPGTLSCKGNDTIKYKILNKVRDVFGYNGCTMKTRSGDTLYMSNVIFQPLSLMTSTGQRVFITVMNTKESTSENDVEEYLLKTLLP